MPDAIVLLSCEGGETYNANPAALETYLDAGGRAFASHFHYAWFSGALTKGQTYAAPADWGASLATWTAGAATTKNNSAIGAILDTVLNGAPQPFPKGVALQKWLGNLGALGQGVPPGEVSIYSARFNAVVGPQHKASQPWITADPAAGGGTMYFSFDTPVTQSVAPDAMAKYCGRAVFSDLHVAGDPTTMDNSPAPAGCRDADLSPQEKALEFMLFDLSSCVIPDTVQPPMGIPIQ
jgi:hypothetical protein